MGHFINLHAMLCRAELEKLQGQSADAVVRLEEAAEKEGKASAALEEADKKLRGLKAERDKMKDYEEREVQHVQVSAHAINPCASCARALVTSHCVGTMLMALVVVRSAVLRILSP